MEPEIDARRVPVTNDDGVFAPGLAVLAAAVREMGHEVALAELPDVEAFAVDGPPGMCVIAAYAQAAIGSLEHAPPDTTVNLNVPNLPLEGFATITFLAPVAAANPPYAEGLEPGFGP